MYGENVGKTFLGCIFVGVRTIQMVPKHMWDATLSKTKTKK